VEHRIFVMLIMLKGTLCEIVWFLREVHVDRRCVVVVIQKLLDC